MTDLAFLPTVRLYEPVKGRNLEGAPIEKRDTLEELVKQARELGGLEHQKLVVSEHIRLQDQIEVTKASILTQ